jgi:hypothetical protein
MELSEQDAAWPKRDNRRDSVKPATTTSARALARTASPTQTALAHETAPLDEKTRLSRAIGIARVICIMGIVYVHAWTGRNGQDLQLFNDTSQGLMRWALIDLMARSSVPLLSMISGWLVGPSFAKRGWQIFLKGKARTILLPMVLWNALAIFFVSGAAYLGLIYAPPGHAVVDHRRAVLPGHAQRYQRADPLPARSVCLHAGGAAAGAPAQPGPDRCGAGRARMVAGAGEPGSGVAAAPSILLFFIAGLLARRHHLAAWMALRPLVLVGAPYAVIATAKVWLEVVGVDRGYNDPLMLASIDLAMRCATAIFFWAIAWRLAASRVAAPLLRIEPYMFLMFCAHLIMIWLLGPLIGDHIFGPIGSPAIRCS